MNTCCLEHRRLGPNPRGPWVKELAEQRERLFGDIAERFRRRQMTARCKFMVQSETRYGHGARQFKLSTVYDNALSQEDRAFSKATPQGEIVVTIDNPAVLDVFQPGKYVYVDIVPCE